MNKIVIFFNKHWLAVLIALFFGFLIVFPTLKIVLDLDSDFKGIYPIMSSDDELYYQAKVKKLTKDNNLGNVYIKDYNNLPYTNSVLAEWSLAKTANIFKISIPKLFAINDFILPAILFFAVYIFFIFLVRIKYYR
ncbi:hypothetical protein KKC83_02030 [Patescibacteria group bacterium]|nr:hypothetical protein [Candidatus Falkowbacteria bacterium]MBU3906014.1 hypothetical protein [Patescibacteria group bacterium]MCG2698456.1 hypothetical protein [Candidatus Parcubacteria bacterium]MBU4026303.1 hypothetical protein [Patescibacteria group bacterium]MBU4073190.1 hypothetical protein [Patescibacteria group bacterium]